MTSWTRSQEQSKSTRTKLSGQRVVQDGCTQDEEQQSSSYQRGLFRSSGQYSQDRLDEIPEEKSFSFDELGQTLGRVAAGAKKIGRIVGDGQGTVFSDVADIVGVLSGTDDEREAKDDTRRSIVAPVHEMAVRGDTLAAVVLRLEHLERAHYDNDYGSRIAALEGQVNKRGYLRTRPIAQGDNWNGSFFVVGDGHGSDITFKTDTSYDISVTYVPIDGTIVTTTPKVNVDVGSSSTRVTLPVNNCKARDSFIVTFRLDNAVFPFNVRVATDEAHTADSTPVPL